LKFESSQKDESRWQSTDSSKAYRNTSAFKWYRKVIRWSLSGRKHKPHFGVEFSQAHRMSATLKRHRDNGEQIVK